MPAMRDSKGQFRKGFDGMKPVGPKAARALKLKKKPEKTLNVPVNSKSTGFGNPAIPRQANEGARVNVNVGALKRNSGSLDGRTPSALPGSLMITKTQGSVSRGDTNTGFGQVKLSKGQQERLAKRDAGMVAGKKKKLAAKAAPGQSQEQKAQAVNNVKVQNAMTMSPAQKIEAYQQMHGKAPSATATKKLNATDARVKAMEASLAKEDAAVRAAEAADKKRLAAKALQPTDSHNAKLKRSTSTADMVVAKNFKPAGGDQKTVIAPDNPRSPQEKALQNLRMAKRGGDPTDIAKKYGEAKAVGIDTKKLDHDAALQRMTDLRAQLERVTAARKARGGKTTSAEEKRLKFELQGATSERSRIALEMANAKPSRGTIGDDMTPAQRAANDKVFNRPQAQKVINPSGRSSSGSRSRNQLGDALTGFIESKGLSAADLKPGGTPTASIMGTPTAEENRLLKEANKIWDMMGKLDRGSPAYKALGAEFDKIQARQREAIKKRQR